MEIFNNIDAETLYTLTSFLGIVVLGIILTITKKITDKTASEKDDVIVEKLIQTNKENLKKLKKK